MKLHELKKAEPATKKSSGTDDPDTYVGKWEEYIEPQGINDRQDKKVLAKESTPHGLMNRSGTENDPELMIGTVEQDEIKKSRKAPLKKAKADAKAFSARGQKPQIIPQHVMETIRNPILGKLSNSYEIVNENDAVIGYANVTEGNIDAMDYDTNATQDYRGQIVSALLDMIVNEADRHRATVAIQLHDPTSELKHLFEQFGFRDVGDFVMKRNHNSIRPASVNPPQGMVNRDD